MTRAEAAEFIKAYEKANELSPLKIFFKYEELLPIIKAFGEGKGIRVVSPVTGIIICYTNKDSKLVFNLDPGCYSVMSEPKRIWVNLYNPHRNGHCGYAYASPDDAVIGNKLDGAKEEAVEFIQVIK